MKKLYVIIAILNTLLLSLPQLGKTQSLDELFNQNATQRKYLLEQIAALRVQIGYIQRSYRIAKNGLDFISKATKGELDLHEAYFLALKLINPEVARYSQVKEIKDMNWTISQVQSRYRNTIHDSDYFSAEQTVFIELVLGRIDEDCREVMTALNDVTTSNKLQMRDDERISRINALHERMRVNLQFVQDFGNSALQLGREREAALRAIQNSRILNNIK